MSGSDIPGTEAAGGHTPARPPVVVVGGGLAGLTTALALGERGHRVTVL
ncbi:MAG: FAD-binding protein, partial [Streptomycetaceae bacterium]|nr:FAD-binding protein [Streptomycetaceae bacterium]